jgi:hypothetical protein
MRYGISERDYNELLRLQAGLCAICAERPARHVDHCHETGEVRGLLCFACNAGLGNLSDDLLLLEAAVDYLASAAPVVPLTGQRRRRPAGESLTRSQYRRRDRYGIEPEDYDALHAAQGGLCALCDERPAEHVDHDHESGRVRGLLCLHCNTGLGNFRDRADLIDRAITYLTDISLDDGWRVA